MRCLQGIVPKQRNPARPRGAAGIMETMLLTVLLGLLLGGFAYWANERSIILSTIRTIDGFQTLMEGCLGYRLENPGTWTDDFTLIDDFVPQLVVQDPRNGGVNGDGGPYQLKLAMGQLSIETTLVNESVARSVVYELGSAASYSASSDGFLVQVSVPTLEDVAALDPTLLTAGTHALQRGFWMSGLTAAGDTCTGKGVSVNSKGELMSCDGGSWKLLSQHP